MSTFHINREVIDVDSVSENDGVTPNTGGDFICLDNDDRGP